MDYIKLYPNIEEMLEEYDDAQRGRLLMAVLAYTFRGEEPEFERGSIERIGWPAFRIMLDLSKEKSERNRTNAKRNGAKPSDGERNEATSSEPEAKPSETERNEATASEPEAKPSEPAPKSKGKDKSKSKGKCKGKPPEGEAVKNTPAPDQQGAMDVAGKMIVKYGLPSSEATLDALMEDIRTHGFATVQNALRDAARKNSRAKVSVAYYRAFLKPYSDPSRDQLARHEYTSEEYRRMIIDLDEEEFP